MRVAILTNAYPPDERGGAGRIAALQVDALNALGHEVRVWHPQIPWLKRPAIVRLFGHLRDLKARPSLVKEIIEWKPDVLITHNLTGCGFGTPKEIRAAGVRWMHVLHDVQLFEPSGQLVCAKKVTLWQRAWSKFRLKALGSPSLVVSPTEWLLREHQRRGFFVSGRSEVLLNPGPVSEAVKRQVHDPLRLLFVGRVAEEKGSNVLAGLAHELEMPFELRVIGDGPEVEDLKNLDHVTCLGSQSPEEVRQQMLWADILLVPSQIEENQPTVILEAAAVGLPVIAADKGGIKETLGEAGIVCPAHDLESWKQAIKSLNQYPTYQNTVQGMYRLAEKHSIENYSAELNSGFLQKGLSAEMP